jgi:hypothetical protein
MRRECEWVNAPNKMPIPFIVWFHHIVYYYTHPATYFFKCAQQPIGPNTLKALHFSMHKKKVTYLSSKGFLWGGGYL